MISTYAAYHQRFVHPAMRATEQLTVQGVTFRYRDVADYDVAELTERDWDGQLVCACAYGLVSALFLIGILIGSLDWKFMIAVGFLGMIAFMSACDAIATRPVTVYILEMTLRNGRQVRFVDADPKVVDTLVARIELAR